MNHVQKPRQLFLLILAGRINRHQQEVIESCSAKTPSQLISLDYWGSGLHPSRHEDFACDPGRTISQSGHLRMVQSGGRAADPRA